MSTICRGPRTIAVFASLCAVTACNVPPPRGPTVMALPPQGKSLTVFQQDDQQCRNHAAAAIGYVEPGRAGTQAVGANNAAASGFDLQTRYNISYTQCMYSVGNTVQNLPVGNYGYYTYGGPWYGYPWYGYPWYGWGWPGFFGGGVFAFGGFHHFHHFHDGFHGGGGFHHG